MKILGIFTMMFFLWTFGYSQEKPDHINRNDKEAKHSARKKITIKKNNNEVITLKKTVDLNKEKLIKVDIQKTNQKIEVRQTENFRRQANSKNQKFGSSTASGQEQKLEKRENLSELSTKELREKLNNPKKLNGNKK